jgi:hypothetical protein
MFPSCTFRRLGGGYSRRKGHCVRKGDIYRVICLIIGPLIALLEETLDNSVLEHREAFRLMRGRWVLCYPFDPDRVWSEYPLLRSGEKYKKGKDSNHDGQRA